MEKGNKKEFILDGLDCAQCALKIEENVNKICGVCSATMNFATKTLAIEAENGKDMELIISDANKVVKRLEPNVVVREKSLSKDDISHYGSISKTEIIRFCTGAIMFVVAFTMKLPFWWEFGIYFASYILVGGEVILKAVRNIVKGQVFDENFLMSLATVGAFAIKEFPEGVAVMLFYQIGEFFQDIAVNRSRKSISALMDIRPDFANLKQDGEVKRVAPEEVKVGDIIIVKPGEKVPLDGRIVEGRSMLDTSTLTGESVPREVEEGSDVLSGSINKNGLLTIETTKEFGESTVSKILDLVQNASSKKAATENFITKFARYYTPVVVFAALALALLPPVFVRGETFSEWINRALVFLVVSCPCALVVSIPLGFFGGIGAASRCGILVKGSNYLEALNNIDTIVFDKTGTLTKGVFKVTDIVSMSHISNTELLEAAAYAESFSSHPIAVSIQKAYGKEFDSSRIMDYEEIAGHGTRVNVDGRTVLAGNHKLMGKYGIGIGEVKTIGTLVHIAVDGMYSGHIVISDELKDDSHKAIRGLKGIGVKKLAMLTGDSKIIGEKIGLELGLDEVYSELLPDQKVEKLEALEGRKSSRGKLVFVGDGINDAPVLARSDIGVAMGGLGSDAAIEAADIVLMTDEPSKLVTAVMIARKTQKVVWQNIIFAIGIKAGVLVLGAGGIATIWEAVFADVGVAVLAILNAMRVMKVDKKAGF